jgi:hypothetical protein
MECGFSGRQGEDQPAVTGVDKFKAEDVAEKCAIRLGFFAVDDNVSAGNHLLFWLNAPSTGLLPGILTYVIEFTKKARQESLGSKGICD